MGGGRRREEIWRGRDRGASLRETDRISAIISVREIGPRSEEGVSGIP